MFIIAIFILGLIVMLLWNALIPVLFHGPELGYWQAVGLLVLVRVLVGIRGRRGLMHGIWHWKKWGPPWMWRKRGWSINDAMQGPGNSNMCGPWGGEWWKKWQEMSPEERQQAKEDWKQKKEEWKSSWHHDH
jgi:hypothetical protein